MVLTYGTLQASVQNWLLVVEPQVRARARRVFMRGSQVAGDVVAISRTPENSRDLEWFIERYPVEISEADRQLLTEMADRHRETESRLADLLEARTPPERVELAEPAREYQLFAGQACEIRGGLLLADAVGVGKTVSGIVPMAHGKNLPAVFVCEPHLARQMERALLRFVPQLQTHRIRKGTPYELRRNSPPLNLREDRLPDVFVISYHMLRGWADTLAELVRYNVFDECQRLRSPASAIYQACKHIARKARMSMGLSATPIYNYGSEFFWVIDLLLPGVLGTREEFVREWCSERGGGDKALIKDTAAFGGYLRREGIMLRRTRKDVGRELPNEPQKIVHTIDCNLKVIEEMSNDAARLARIIVAHNENYRGQLMQASGEFDAMVRQATGVAKAPYVAEFVRLLLESGESVILFGWHREVYGIWKHQLREFYPVMYTGSESPSQKAEAERLFKSGESRLMFMSLRSGAGVDGLQEACSVVVFGELDWSPAVYEQCIGRVDRDGQLDKVVGYFLVAESGSDPVMAEVCGIKTEQREGVINPTGPLVERIETGEHHIRRLARELLERRGETVDAPPPRPAVLEERV